MCGKSVELISMKSSTKYIRDRHNSCDFLVIIAMLAIATFGDHDMGCGCLWLKDGSLSLVCFLVIARS